MALGDLAIDLLEISRMAPESRPHRLLGKGHLPPRAALALDRIVLAAAKRRRAYDVQLALMKPGEMGMEAVLRLLASLNLR